MVRKIGSNFFIWLLLFSCANYAQTKITISSTDADGEPLAQAAKSVAFAIEVAISGDDVPNSTPLVPGLNQLHVQGQGLVSTFNRTVNGKRSMCKTFRYMVRADKTGTLKIGPVIMNIAGTRVESNILTLLIAEQQKNVHSQPTLQLCCPLTKAVIGQAVPLTIRFFPGGSTQLVDMSKLELPEGTLEPISGPYSGNELIDDIETPYIEWRTTWHPAKIGSVTIPALHGVYKSASKKRSQQFGFDLLTIFNHGFEQKNIYSNTLSITVDALPYFGHEVTAVGKFKKLRSLIEPTQARVGEGMVLKLLLSGKGNMQAIDAPVLALPDGLKYYESKQYIEQSTKDTGLQTKVFEYIVQGVNEGSYEIPAQTFYFYDVDAGRYKKLTSNPLEIAITVSSPVQPQEQTKQSPKTENQLAPILEHHWMETQQRRIAFPIFLLLLLIPLLLLLSMYAYSWRAGYYAKHSVSIQRNRAAFYARKALKHAIKNNDIAAVYPIFVTFFAHKAQMTVSEDGIINFLKQKNFSADDIARWNAFYAQCGQAAFAGQSVSIDTIFNQAETWLTLFSERF